MTLAPAYLGLGADGGFVAGVLRLALGVSTARPRRPCLLNNRFNQFIAASATWFYDFLFARSLRCYKSLIVDYVRSEET